MADPGNFPILEEPRAKREKTDTDPKSSKKSSKPNPLISSSEKCKVCLEPAAIHIHYGAVTCFSCRAFFRRSIQNNQSDAYKCRKDGNCDITLKSRKSCQRCRFEKCLHIGMKSNWVLSEEERYHRFRKHRERVQQKDPSSGDQQEDIGSHSSPEQGQNTSPLSSRSYSGMDSDTERSFYQYSHNISPPSISPTLTVQPQHMTMVKSEEDYEPSRVPNFYGLDFSRKVPESMVKFENRDSSLIFPVRFQLDEPMMCDPPMVTHEPEEPVNLKVEPSTSGESTSDCRSHYSEHVEYHDPRRAMEQPGSSNVPMQEPTLPMPRSFLGLEMMPEVTVDEMSQIKAIARIHDVNYKSINFGEELIKEMVMSSVFKVPLSPSATMTAYRLMIQRVTRVAQGFDAFINLPFKVQSLLLKHNADLIVSLRGAVFFEKRKGGLDQILISMGVDDLMAAKNMVMTAMKTTKLERIDYQTFNTLQKVENSQTEERYNMLLERVGVTASFDADLVKMLSYILLFSVNFPDRDPNDWRDVEHIQEVMIGMMQRYIFAQYPKQIAVKLFSGLLRCVADLQELTWIKKQRQMASQATAHISEDNSILTNANRPVHLNP